MRHLGVYLPQLKFTKKKKPQTAEDEYTTITKSKMEEAGVVMLI